MTIKFYHVQASVQAQCAEHRKELTLNRSILAPPNAPFVTVRDSSSSNSTPSAAVEQRPLPTVKTATTTTVPASSTKKSGGGAVRHSAIVLAAWRSRGPADALESSMQQVLATLQDLKQQLQ